MTDHPHDRAENRLARSRSPYLLLHRHNPVDWYEWGEEPIERARREDKPIFLSVGYSTCYWCHVMERESFSDEAIAARMNADFVNVKLDREERPDLDEIYMTATQILTGHGGWPNSLFLTPRLEPFFAGTYFPPADRPGLPGFTTVLSSMSQAWSERRDDVESQAASVATALRRHLDLEPEETATAPPGDAAGRSLEDLERVFDQAHGGFGGAPKFPTPSNLLLLLELADGSEAAARMLEVTLDQMARGGIYDQLGGGFHRYATDREWMVPHFEKMLYDNGLLLEVYARHWERTGDRQAERIIRQTAEFLARELTAPEGGFYSALDAETDGREGAFYVWTRDQLLAVLGEGDFAFLAPIYGFQGAPFFEHSNYVLHLPATLEQQAAKRRIDYGDLIAELAEPSGRLLEARAGRPPLLVDDKILADWNGLAIGGLATAGRVLDAPELIDQARAAAVFVLETMRSAGGVLLHAWRDGGGAIEAFLADYAFLVHGLLALGHAAGEERWVEAARELTAEQIERLEDPRGGFFSTVERDDVLVRSKDYFDGALPAANAMAILNLLELTPREPGFLGLAERALVAAAGPLERAPSAARTLAVAAQRLEAARGGAVEPSPEPPAAEDEAPSRVEAAAELGEPDAEGWRALRLTLTIEVGWHVYAAYVDGDAPEWVRPTTLEPIGLELSELTYPPPRELGELLGSERILIYEGVVEIAARVRFAAGEEPALVLRYQPCDESRCLAPASLEIGLR